MDGSLAGPGSAIAAILAAIIVGATFAGVDAGLSALGEVRLRALLDAKGPYAKTAKRALEDLDGIQARLLAGRVICLTTAAAVASAAVIQYKSLPVVIGAAAAVALFYALFAEAATTIARRRAGPWALWMLRWLRLFEILMIPLALPLELLGRALERSVPQATPANPERVAELGLERMIDEGQEEGAIRPDHADLLRSVLEFKNTVAHQVMVPRTNMVAIDISTPAAEVIELIVDKGHSRYPVYRDKVDQVVGILYAKDLFQILRQRTSVHDVSLGELTRKLVFFVAESQKIGTLLKEMQARRVHLAVVVDEFGGTSGIVTLEDILEEIVGDIRDEYDREETSVFELGGGRYLVDAGLSIYDLEDRIGAKLMADEVDYDSVGGLVVGLAGHVPTIGESVTASGFRFTVRDADQRRVRRVEVVRA